MSIKETRPTRFLTAAFGLTLALTAAASAQVAAPSSNNRSLTQVNTRPVPVGAKVKFRGVIVRRDADTFVVRDASRNDTQVLITDETSIKTKGGFFGGGKKYPVTDLLTGLIVEVEGRGDRQGQLVADKIRFNDSDMRAAITTETRVGPVEENQLRLSGQIDELSARIAACASRRLSRPSASKRPGTNSSRKDQWTSRHCQASNLPHDHDAIATKAMTSGPFLPVNAAATSPPIAISIAPAGQSAGR